MTGLPGPLDFFVDGQAVAKNAMFSTPSAYMPVARPRHGGFTDLGCNDDQYPITSFVFLAILDILRSWCFILSLRVK
jgi:hypothetical protein